MKKTAYLSQPAIEKLEKNVAKMNKRARRAGKAGYILTVDRDDYQTIEAETERYEKVMVKKFKTVISWEGVQMVEGWKFLGAIDHSLSKNLLFGEIPETYRESKAYCDHCKTNRKRNKTVILKKDNEIKQIGSTCLTAYLPEANVEEITDYLKNINFFEKIYSLVDSDIQEGGCCGSASFGYNVKEVVTIACSFVRTEGGFKPSSWDCSTSNCVKGHLTSKLAKDRAEILPVDRERAQMILGWVRQEVAKDSPVGYLGNLAAVCSEDWIEWKHLGIAVSAVNAYDKATGKEIERKAAKKESNYVGEIKEKIEFSAEVSHTSGFEGSYGYVHLYKMIDENGNRFSWFASRDQELQTGDKVSVKGTVKNHNEYKGIKETVLTRCKVSKKED